MTSILLKINKIKCSCADDGVPWFKAEDVALMLE